MRIIGATDLILPGSGYVNVIVGYKINYVSAKCSTEELVGHCESLLLFTAYSYLPCNNYYRR